MTTREGPGMPWTGVGPQPTGRLREVNLTGALLAWEHGVPVLFRMPGSSAEYVACFSSEERLRAFHERGGFSFESIKRIDDQADFLSSFEGSPIIVILDPYFTDEGRVRFVQLPTMGPTS